MERIVALQPKEKRLANLGGYLVVREIIQLGNPLLRRVCEPVIDPTALEVRRIVEDLADTLRHSKQSSGYGRAIAAPQIGELKRIVYLSVPEPFALINPEIIGRSAESVVVWDACLSFLCIFMQVRRYRDVTIRYQDLGGVEHVLQAGALYDLGELLQHEIDHLDGILAIDRAVDMRSICTREEFETRFRENSPYAEVNSEAVKI